MRRRLTPAVLFVPVVFGCGTHPSSVAPAPRNIAARDSLLSTDAARSADMAKDGPINGPLVWLAPDAAYLRSGLPTVWGHAQIQAILIDAPILTAGTPSFHPLGGAVSADGTAGYTYGATQRAATSANAARSEHYLAFWRRTPTTRWKVVAYAELDAGPVKEARVLDALIPDPSGGPRMERLCVELAQADSAFAERSHISGTPAAFESFLARDGIAFADSGMIVGPLAERTFLEGRRTSLIWHPVFAGAAASGDLGYTVGVDVATGLGSTGAAEQHFGKYLTVWRRDGGGAWKVVADGGSGTPTPGGKP